MELPKNITQIGEVNPFCKIYVEDYVISYLKQLNQVAISKDMSVALYGERKTEGDISYLFLYGACKLDFLQRETRHLSQAQKQEIEKLRKKYFANYEFLGYRLLSGEMIEGFHVCEQEICRYIEGYAQFYTKNDSMLAYMLDSREEESVPEIVDRSKYEEVKRKQEARKEQVLSGQPSSEERNLCGDKVPLKDTTEKKSGVEHKIQPAGMRRMRMATVATFLVLCVAGLSDLGGENGTNRLREAAKDLVAEVSEQKLPDASLDEKGEAVAQANSTLVAQEKLTQALQQENMENTQEVSTQPTTGQAREQNTTAQPTTGQAREQNATAQATTGQAREQNTTMQPTSEQAKTQDAATQPTSEQTQTQTQDAATQPTFEQTQTQETTTQSNIESTQVPEPVSKPEQTVTEQAVTESTPQQTQTKEVSAKPISYTINEGDTLLRICLTHYGTTSFFDEVCALNEIKDPDDIKVGQKILLPQ